MQHALNGRAVMQAPEYPPPPGSEVPAQVPRTSNMRKKGEWGKTGKPWTRRVGQYWVANLAHRGKRQEMREENCCRGWGGGGAAQRPIPKPLPPSLCAVPGGGGSARGVP